ncbi:hypothetical protein ANANG_G00081690, partial [Anguilla anguilla]
SVSPCASRLLVPVFVLVGLPIVPVSGSLFPPQSCPTQSSVVVPRLVAVLCPPRPSPVLYVCLAPVQVPPGFLSPPVARVRALIFPRVARCAGPEFPPSRPMCGP